MSGETVLWILGVFYLLMAIYIWKIDPTLYRKKGYWKFIDWKNRMKRKWLVH